MKCICVPAVLFQYIFSYMCVFRVYFRRFSGVPGPDGACGDAARAAAGVAISTGKLGRPPNVSGEVYLCHSTAISVHFFIYVCILDFLSSTTSK